MSVIRIGLASPHFPASVADAVSRVTGFLEKAARSRVDLVCFPETYIPGMRGQDFPVGPPDQRQQASALESVRAAAAKSRVACIIPMEWEAEAGLQNVAFVIAATGEVLGVQTKNQVPLEEEPYFKPGSSRQVFTVNGVRFGIAICHEGWRYPETVRWAAARGAKIVFHPHYVGGAQATATSAAESAFYEKAMVVRAAENSIFFASVNFALPHQDAATTLIGPYGECLARAPRGEESLLTYDVDTTWRLACSRAATNRCGIRTP